MPVSLLQTLPLLLTLASGGTCDTTSLERLSEAINQGVVTGSIQLEATSSPNPCELLLTLTTPDPEPSSPRFRVEVHIRLEDLDLSRLTVVSSSRGTSMTLHARPGRAFSLVRRQADSCARLPCRWDAGTPDVSERFDLAFRTEGVARVTEIFRQATEGAQVLSVR
jgi:hypothetical protein